VRACGGPVAYRCNRRPGRGGCAAAGKWGGGASVHGGWTGCPSVQPAAGTGRVRGGREVGRWRIGARWWDWWPIGATAGPGLAEARDGGGVGWVAQRSSVVGPVPTGATGRRETGGCAAAGTWGRWRISPRRWYGGPWCKGWRGWAGARRQERGPVAHRLADWTGGPSVQRPGRAGPRRRWRRGWMAQRSSWVGLVARRWNT
jgi:hypothetical protein